MSMASHRSALELKHKFLEQQIADEMSRPLADANRVQELKRQKLRLKEEIVRLSTNSAGNTLH